MEGVPQPYLGILKGLTITMVINHLLHPGMMLQAVYFPPFTKVRPVPLLNGLSGVILHVMGTFLFWKSWVFNDLFLWIVWGCGDLQPTGISSQSKWKNRFRDWEMENIRRFFLAPWKCCQLCWNFLLWNFFRNFLEIMSLIGRFGILNPASIHHPHGSCDKKPFIYISYIYYISYIRLRNLNIHKSFQNWYMFNVHSFACFAGVFWGRDLRQDNIPPMATNDPRWTWPRTSNHQRLGPMRFHRGEKNSITLGNMGSCFFFGGGEWNFGTMRQQHVTWNRYLFQENMWQMNANACFEVVMLRSQRVIIHGCMSCFSPI